MKSSANDSPGKNPIEINHTNQTTIIRKFLIGFNPINFLYKFFKQNRRKRGDSA
jgi:hypothetical protein